MGRSRGDNLRFRRGVAFGDQSNRGFRTNLGGERVFLTQIHKSVQTGFKKKKKGLLSAGSAETFEKGGLGSQGVKNIKQRFSKIFSGPLRPNLAGADMGARENHLFPRNFSNGGLVLFS